MECRKLGPGGPAVPLMGQGTWRLDRQSTRRSIETLRYGCDVGMTHIDTAELYGDGFVERQIVREVVRGRRGQIFLTSKVRPPHTHCRAVIRACERSLRRLGTDHLDLYLLHWRGRTPLAETLEAFERLRQAGKIRAYGVSNFTLTELKVAVAMAGPGRIACNQVAYSATNRAAEVGMIPWCARRGIAVVAYSPLGAGTFPAEGTRRRRLLERIGRAHGASARQVALAFLLRHPNVFVIPKHSSRSHAKANAEAAALRLTAGEIHALERLLPLTPAVAPPPDPDGLAFKVLRGAGDVLEETGSICRSYGAQVAREVARTFPLAGRLASGVSLAPEDVSGFRGSSLP